jgi:hypothetical protein
MKKIGAGFLVLNLIVSMIAFSVIFNVGVVSASEECTNDASCVGNNEKCIRGACTTCYPRPGPNYECVGEIKDNCCSTGWEEKPSVADALPGGISLIDQFTSLIPKGKDSLNTAVNPADNIDGDAFEGYDKLTEYSLDAACAQVGKMNKEDCEAWLGTAEGKKELQQIADGDGKTGSMVGDWMLKNKWFGGSTGMANAVGHLASGLAWAGTAVGAIKLIGGFFLEDEMTDALSTAAFGGIMAGKGAYGLFKSGGFIGSKIGAGSKFAFLKSGWTSGVIGVGVGAAIFLATYEKESTKTVHFECLPWDAPVGGHDCDECNDQAGKLPCSEYQCRSLGQACEMINTETDEPKCIWKNKNDVAFPIITPWDDALIDETYKYSPDNTISPPDRGVKVINTGTGDGCVQAFTPITFGVETDELAKCKIDYQRKETFDEMEFWFGASSTFKMQHQEILSLPGPNEAQNGSPIIDEGGNYNLYTRCQDANGNVNTANFVFKYCVEEGPDTTPPFIVGTDLMTDMPIAFNQSSVDIEVYVNEPAECKWSHLDQSYENMETQMTCENSVTDMNAQMVYKCSTTLSGLLNEVSNDFYFKCKDQPLAEENDRNTMIESYPFTLIGTQPLVIDAVGPEGTIKNATNNVQVTLKVATSAGYKEGEARCYFGETETTNNEILFGNTNSHKHSQDLWLEAGDYTYYVMCIDLGGNSDTAEISFTVESDSSSPIVVRAYREENNLKLITNEPGECVYSTDSCSYLFEDGIKMNVFEKINHFTEWKTQNTLYIKCKDEFGNRPYPDQCSIIAKPFDVE